MTGNKILDYSKNIGTYFCASLIPMILNLVSNPFIAKNLEPEDYAVVGYYSSFTTLIQPLVMFYMLHYYTKRYFELDDGGRKELSATIMQSLIWFSGVLSLICLGGVILYTACFNKDTTMPLFPYVAMSVLTIPLSGLMTLATTDYRMSRRSVAFFKISVSNGVILVIFNLLFVVVLKWGAIGKLLAPLLTSFLFFIYCLNHYKELLRIPFNWAIFKRMIFFCWPLTIAAMLGFFSNGYDRVLLERLGNANEFGYYCVGFQIAMYVNVFQTALSSTFQPDIFQSIAEKKKKRLLSVIALQIVGIAGIVGVFIVFAPFVVNVLTAGRYMLSVGYTRILVLSSVTSMVYYCLSQVTIALGYTRITLINKILSSVIMVGLYGLLISKYQYIGAAWGQVLSYVVFLLGNIVLLVIFNNRNRKNHVIKNI